MKSQLSELFDGELEAQSARPLIGSVARDAEMRRSWETYVLIADRLRNEVPLEKDMTADVMARLREEPIVLAPRNVNLPPRQHPLLALAASVAGVAVVGWLALGVKPGAWSDNPLAAVPTGPTLARGLAQSEKHEAGKIETVAMRGDMRELLLAHQMQASTFRLGDSTEHIRTVSATGRAVTP